nr:hypothetical protein BgiMline_033245 [Biomphalaria glabrata]
MIVIATAVAFSNAKSLDEGAQSALCGIDQFAEIVNDTVVCSPCPVDSLTNASQHNLTECSRRERKLDLSEYWNFRAGQVHARFFVIGMIIATIIVIVLAFFLCGWHIFYPKNDTQIFTILGNGVANMWKQLKKFMIVLKRKNNATSKKKEYSKTENSKHIPRNDQEKILLI